MHKIASLRFKKKKKESKGQIDRKIDAKYKILVSADYYFPKY